MKKSRLGQNFLLDLNLTRKIARSAGDMSEATVLEIGPGGQAVAVVPDALRPAGAAEGLSGAASVIV